MNPSVRDQFEVLKALVGADEEIRKLDLELQKERDALEGVKQDLARVRDQIEQERQRYDDVEHDRNGRVQEGRVLQQQLDRSREKMNRTRNEKESNAVQRELEETRKLLRDVEDAAGKRMLELDELRKSIIEHEEQEAGFVARIGETEGAVSKRLTDLEADRAGKLAARAEVAKKLPATTLRKYDVIRAKRTSGAARLEGGRCKACNISLPPQLAQRIARGEVLEGCPSCNRLLYTEPTQPPTTPTAT